MTQLMGVWAVQARRAKVKKENKRSWHERNPWAESYNGESVGNFDDDTGFLEAMHSEIPNMH